MELLKVLTIFFFLTLSSAILLGEYEDALDTPDIRTVHHRVLDIIHDWGYPAEEHFVTTDDGYILALHRIPHGRHGRKSQDRAIPVFLGHCLVGSSAMWAFGPPEYSLAYLLADAGYDVWMPNIRGNTYSRNHTYLDTCGSCSEFWDFNIETSALIDYPLFIDFILNHTGASDLHFAGYSMGTTQFLMLMADKPEYNQKVRTAYLLGPTAFGGNATNPLLPLAQHAESIVGTFRLFGFQEFLPNLYGLQSRLFGKMCRTTALNLKICTEAFALSIGLSSDKMDSNLVPLYMTHMPAGGSLGQFHQYAQLFRNGGKFTKFDYGTFSNLVRYGSAEPPEYDLSQVTVPVAFFVGDNDGFATKADADKLFDALPNVFYNELLPSEGWTHLDFFLAHDAKELVNERIVHFIQDFDNAQQS